MIITHHVQHHSTTNRFIASDSPEMIAGSSAVGCHPLTSGILKAAVLKAQRSSWKQPRWALLFTPK
jgi:hypothetical protein